MQHKRNYEQDGDRRGFTIVELLIVIVVIAILAAVTIVAYNGISQKAKESAAQSAAQQIVSKVQAYAVTNADEYPADLASIGFVDDGTTTFQYSVNNTASPRTYCATVTVSNVSYFVSNTQSSPQSGGCAGHGQGGVASVTNLATNPSFEMASGTVEVRRNLHENPGAVGTTGYQSWDGGTGNVRTLSNPAASWSASGSALRSTWTTVAVNNGDVAAKLANAMTAAGTGARLTAVMRWRVSSTRLVDQPGIAPSPTSGEYTQNSRNRSGTFMAQAGVTYTDWVTFTVGTGWNPDTRLWVNFKPVASGDWVEVSEVDIYLGNFDPGRDWFYGASPAAGDFTYAWTGTPNASPSVQRGVGLPTVSTANPERAVRIQSSEWSKSGTKSVRVIPVANPTYAEMNFSGLTIGRAYTLVATVSRTAPGAGSSDPRARTFWVVGGGDPAVTMTTTPPNAAGEYEMRGVFVATATFHGIRIMNGYTVGDMWVDDFMIVEVPDLAHPYTGPARSGDSPNWIWNGTPNASTSTGPGL